MTTMSRYDYMTEGVTQDEELGSYYPDPLSLNYLNLKLSDIPDRDVMTDSKIIYFWNEANSAYGVPYYDDIVLTINGISHKNFLNPGDIIYFPKLDDIKESYSLRG